MFVQNTLIKNMDRITDFNRFVDINDSLDVYNRHVEE